MPQQVSDVDSLATDSDDEGLKQARQNRLQELQQQARLRASEQEQGLGFLQDMPSNALQDLVQSTDMPIVCHLVAEGLRAGDEMDELLQKLAGRYRGTYFCRTPIASKGDAGFRHLAVEQFPGLFILDQGKLASQILQDELQEDDDIVEERVMSYLKQCGALRESTGPHQDAATATEGMDEKDEEGGEWQEPCEICGRRYHHEHVRAVTRGNQHSGYDSN
ncbi:g7736 [Coccomyxa viridis]|uniref:G7736 protein n=1 Tax=Coccomyxa viridis TaxID=1274662 RepID=A0ABP1FYL7_9CHLO